MSRLTFTDMELMYAATARCQCGAGLAHPMDHDKSLALRAWICSRVLRGEAQGPARHPDWPSGQATGEHDALDWAMWKVREETSINNAGARTTRPAGTIARTIGKAVCPKCKRAWESQPYLAPEVGHHWRSGPCPGCGYAVGADGCHNSNDGPAIDMRFPDVILAAP